MIQIVTFTFLSSTVLRFAFVILISTLKLLLCLIKIKTVCDGTFIDIVLTLCNVCAYKYCNSNETVENVSIKE